MSQALGVNDLGLQGGEPQSLGRDLKGIPCGKNLPLLRKRGGTQREAHTDVVHRSPICSFIQPPFTTACSLPGPASGTGETEREHATPPRSHGPGETGTRPDRDSRGTEEPVGQCIRESFLEEVIAEMGRKGRVN